MDGTGGSQQVGSHTQLASTLSQTLSHNVKEKKDRLSLSNVDGSSSDTGNAVTSLTVWGSLVT